nr:polysaccharide pyruvyl transferase family protein [Aeromicrobium piscarium]
MAATLDASGFFLGDQWAASSIARDARSYGRLSKRGRPIIMLPQAFGPFDRPAIADEARRLLDQATLIFARDAVSLGHLAALIGNGDDRIAMVPDITIALDSHPVNVTDRIPQVAVVPNVNIPARADGANSRERYVASLANVCGELERRGLEPILLAHSLHGDPEIVREVTAVRPGVRVENPADGLAAKAIISRCAGVVAGRYHAIVSALSQGVPAVAHSWSHKYGELYGDFGIAPQLADPFKPEESVSVLDDLLRDQDLPGVLVAAQARLSTTIGEMWHRVDRAIGSAS